MLWKSNSESKVVATGWLRCFDKDSSRKLAKFTTELAGQSKDLVQSLLVYGSSNSESSGISQFCYRVYSIAYTLHGLL